MEEKSSMTVKYLQKKIHSLRVLLHFHYTTFPSTSLGRWSPSEGRPICSASPHKLPARFTPCSALLLPQRMDGTHLHDYCSDFCSEPLLSPQKRISASHPFSHSHIFPQLVKTPRFSPKERSPLRLHVPFCTYFHPKHFHSADSLTSSLEVTFWFHHFTQNALTKLTNHRPAARGHGPFTVMVL